MELTGKNSIAGVWSAAGTETFAAVNPRNRESGPVDFHNATAAEINQAVEAAAQAYVLSREYDSAQLADFLIRLAAGLDSLGADLVALADEESGLGEQRLSSELQRTTSQIRRFADMLDEGSYVQAVIDTAEEAAPDVRRILLPIGPVGVFAASNFPLAFGVAGGDTVSAFAAGCPVVAKAHPSQPGTAERVARAINDAVKDSGFPPGFFSMIQGNSHQSGQALVMHPQIAAVGFTGSHAGGRALYDLAATRPRPIPVYAEMGSINPMVILPQVMQNRLDSLVEQISESATRQAGQFCTNPGLLLMLDNPLSDQFIQRYTEQMTALETCGPMLNQQILDGVAATVQQTLQNPGVQRRSGAAVDADSAGYYYLPTVLVVDSADFREDYGLQREHFGPVTLIVKCQTVNDLLRTLRTLHGVLAATVMAEDDEMDLAAAVFTELKEKAGRVIWNDVPTGVRVVAAMHHGGPYPATTAPATTSVGTGAITRFMRPVAYQNMPDHLLPPALQDANPLQIGRSVNGQFIHDALKMPDPSMGD